MFAVICWLGLLMLLSFLTLPVASKLRLVYASKIFGLIFLSYIVWLFANILDFKTASLVGLLTYMAFCIPLLIKYRDKTKNLIIDSARFEIVFILSFLIYLLYTAFNPDIFGGEKMMDVGVLSGILRSCGMPPIDVNLAGFRFDCYYYMGYLIVATLTSLTHASIGVAFNLGLATFFASVLTLSVEFAIRNRVKLLPVLLLAGNLASFAILIGCGLQRMGLIHIGELKPERAFDFWTVTRIIPGTINEFPFATLTFRDLHPHLMDIPFQILFLILLFEYIKLKDRKILAFLSFLLGFMFTVNSWEFPTYLALLTLTILIFGRFEDLIMLPLAVVPFVPYHIKLHPYAVKGIGIVTERSLLPNFIVAQPLILIPLCWIAWKNKKLFLAMILPLIPIAFFLNFQLLPILIPIAVLSGMSLLKRDTNFENVLIFISAITLLLVEVFYVDDPYPQKWERLNTVFKTYIQAWIMLSFASSFIVSKVKDRRSVVAVAVFIVILWIYPLGYLTTLHGFRGSIDGMLYIKKYGEYDALRFLQSCPNGVVLEFPGEKPFESYTYAGRVSAFTGLQSVIARSGHELFWRYFNNSTIPMLLERWSDASRIYSATSIDAILPLLKKYNVKYIYIGYLEKQHYNEKALRKFEKFKKIYDDGKVEIYEVTFLTAKSHN